MNKLYYFSLFSLLLFTSCDFSNNVREQLSFLTKMSEEFGGLWNGSNEGGCYKIEITNSERLNNNTDSLDYLGVLIGRKFIKTLGLNYSCLMLELINEKKVAMISKSTSKTKKIDLEIINRFNDRTIQEYIIASSAINACQNADFDNLIQAEKWLSDIDSTLNDAFIELARASIDRARGNSKESKNRINRLIESNTSDDLLVKYIGIYFIKTNEFNRTLSLFKHAAELNKNNNEHLMDIGSIYFDMTEYDSSALYFSQVIERDSLNLKALYNRAECRFKENEITLGCNDINRILVIAPKVNLPESIMNKCGQND